ncbi:MAG: NAD(P)/FAD-dependent oxidoreductase [Culturomica sp.]|jgi:protoporphyrinogen oxidase|nr:NAD(P)/FAD-dependent oxidoreductase [Culturomica sp.]
MNRRKISIIGAGPAGLTAAYEILKSQPSAHVDIYESTDRIGGISTTIEHNGCRIDIGGHRFFSKSKRVNELWQELMPTQGAPAKDDALLAVDKRYAEVGPDPERTDAVMLLRRRVSRIFYRRRFFDYPIALKSATFVNMGFVNTLKAAASYMYSTVHKLPETSLENFYINRFGRHLYSMFFEDYTQKVWGVHPSQLDASWGAQRVKELSVLGILKEATLKIFNPQRKTNQTSLIEQFLYPKFGPGELWTVMAEQIQKMGGKIYFNSVVKSLKITGNSIVTLGVENNGIITEHAVDVVLSTMPVKDLVAAIDMPVPEDVKRIAAGLPYRDFITVGLLVNKLLLKNKTNMKTVGNIVPDCWIYIQERDVKIGRLQIFNNWSPYMVKDFEHTVWIGLEYFCNEGDEMWTMPREEFIKFAIDELVKIKIIDREDVLDAVQVKMPKAYPAYFGTYGEMDKVKDYLDSLQNLYCIGRNGQHRYNNMDHSMLTAMEAVKNIQTNKIGKDNVWAVNTEEDYHENK